MSLTDQASDAARTSGPTGNRAGSFILGRLALAPASLLASRFLVFALMFQDVKARFLVTSACQDGNGDFTLDNIFALSDPQIVSSYSISLRVSAVAALIGALIGLIICLAVIRGQLPGPIRSAVLTFSGVASNFAGIPLAFAFLATLGRLGIVTIILKTVFGFDIYRAGFNILSFWGLTITYLYFSPADDPHHRAAVDG